MALTNQESVILKIIINLLELIAIGGSWRQLKVKWHYLNAKNFDMGDIILNQNQFRGLYCKAVCTSEHVIGYLP